ncbi:MAG: carbohydrate binding domain-containing protein [Planctomycetota bacterium]
MRTAIAIFLSCLVSVGLFAEENLVVNPGFEDISSDSKPPSEWTQERGSPVQVPDDGGHTGKRYVRMTDRTEKEGIPLGSKPVPARPGGQYRASAWVRTGDKGGPGVYINFFDDVGTRIHNVFQRAKAPTDGWVKVEVAAAAPDDAASVSVWLYSYVGDVGTYDFDDVTLTVRGGGEPGIGKVPRSEPKEKEMVEIGSRLELFVDGFMVDSMTGDATRLLHHPEHREVAVTFDKPWEGIFCGYVVVMSDDDRIRIYYRGWPGPKGRDCECVVESADGGVTFTRPNVGIYEVEGSKENNIVWMGPGGHNFTPFKDANPAAPAEQRYKALASAGPKSALVPFTSPDGYKWTMIQKEPVITKGAFDSQNLAFWDTVRKEYVCYFRIFKDGIRDISRCTSQDFIHWTEPQPLDYGGAPAEHLYTNAIAPYPRAPHILIGLPCRFVPNRKKIQEHKEGGINDGVLMSSRDGLHFERWVEAFLRPGPDPLCWTDRNNYPAWGVAQTSETELSVYWNEHYRYPTHRLRRGTIRTDGFVSVHAGTEGGEMLTRSFTFEGGKLIVNYETSAIGSLRFELCDAEGKPYDGFGMGESETLFGNEIAHEATWKNGADVSALSGKPVRLRVRLKDADLYSFRFAK